MAPFSRSEHLLRIERNRKASVEPESEANKIERATERLVEPPGKLGIGKLRQRSFLKIGRRRCPLHPLDRLERSPLRKYSPQVYAAIRLLAPAEGQQLVPFQELIRLVDRLRLGSD